VLSMLWQLLAGHVFGCQTAVPSAALKVKLKLIQAAVKGGRGGRRASSRRGLGGCWPRGGGSAPSQRLPGILSEEAQGDVRIALHLNGPANIFSC